MELIDNSRNLTQQLAYELGRAIVQGKYKIDAVFPTEAELSAQFNISRSVTREAVKMLTAKGLISSRPRKGIRVQPAQSWNMFDTDVLNWTLAAKPSLQLLKEFTQLRLAIEPEAVALACGGASKTQLDAIADALTRVEFALRGEDDALEALTLFHVRLLEASNNRFFVQFCDFIRAALRVSMAWANQMKFTQSADVRDYRRICDAIRSGDADMARQYTRGLLEQVMSTVTQAIAENPKAALGRHSLAVV